MNVIPGRAPATCRRCGEKNRAISLGMGFWRGTAVWIDNDDLDRLREYQQTVGVPVSESVRRAIKAYLENLVNRKRA